MEYKLEKEIWSQDDFKVMGWHDCPIYAIQFANDIFLDIDYIFKWVLDEKRNRYQFWISPATLQFLSPFEMEMSVKIDFVNGLEIADINQKPLSNGVFEYHIDTQEGDIRFKSKGFRQYIRKTPVLVESQGLTEEQRGGYPLKSSNN